MSAVDMDLAVGFPYYQHVEWAFYVTRSLSAELEGCGTTLEEWRSFVGIDSLLLWCNAGERTGPNVQHNHDLAVQESGANLSPLF